MKLENGRQERRGSDPQVGLSFSKREQKYLGKGHGDTEVGNGLMKVNK